MRTWRQKKNKQSDYTRNKGKLKAKRNLRPKSTLRKKYSGKFILPSSPWGDKTSSDRQKQHMKEQTYKTNW